MNFFMHDKDFQKDPSKILMMKPFLIYIYSVQIRKIGQLLFYNFEEINYFIKQKLTCTSCYSTKTQRDDVTC